MKHIVILGLFLLAGCGSYPTLESLKAEALVSGDWSAVEQRERNIEKRRQRQGPTCPDDYIAFCKSGFSAERCVCARRQAFYSMSLR